MATDPVCGMTVDESRALSAARDGGVWHYSAACLTGQYSEGDVSEIGPLQIHSMAIASCQVRVVTIGMRELQMIANSVICPAINGSIPPRNNFKMFSICHQTIPDRASTARRRTARTATAASHRGAVRHLPWQFSVETSRCRASITT